MLRRLSGPFAAVFRHGKVGRNHRNGQAVRGDGFSNTFGRARFAVDADDGGAHAEGVIAGAGGETGQLIEGDCAHPFVVETFGDAYRERQFHATEYTRKGIEW